ncbi:hybrid sensor histidine kinase/response regulator [Caulobacter sp. NIBR2454]|uniref:hybrid sensor histidine kinase/response regulator n=1 Tax=Caulobacter sp. NIBR2454 TaxID=3015996 RepID=UPI0022B6557F|nr:ATP-binding protein [Caulobacter sp. NIBR2454]
MAAWLDLQRDEREQAVCACALAAVFTVSAVLTKVINDVTGVPTIWLGNGLLIGGLLALRPRWGLVMLVLSMFGDVMVDLFTGRSLKAMIVYPSLDLIETLIAVWFARRFCSSALRLKSIRDVLVLLAFAALPAVAIVGALAGVANVLFFGREFLISYRVWFFADLLGVCMTLPATMVILNTRHNRDFARSMGEHLAFYAGLAGVVFLAFLESDSPLSFLIFPALILATFRLGPRGAAFGAAVVAVVALPMTLQGAAPALLNDRWALVDRLQVLHLFIVTVFITSLAAALELAKQASLRRLLVRRDRIARAARAKALAANEAKSQFLANMSHEVRTPLNSILGFARLLSDRNDLPADVNRQLDLIDQAGESLLTVVNDVLDFSRMEAGQVELDLRAVDLRRLMEDSVAIIAADARAKGLELRTDFQGLPDRVHRLDDRRARQVLLNLLNNAVKFTASGSVTLRVRVTPYDDMFDDVRVEVIDTGVGIAPGAQENLFRRFSQADSSVGRSYGGTGLGLAICKGLVELAGGKIGVMSELGAGSTFWIDWRAKVASVAADAPPEPATIPASARLLLVDDHPMNREVGVALLSAAGCVVDTAASGEEAVALVAAKHYDAVLMDVHMPGMGGLAATRVIRGLDGPAAGVPIIAMSADALPQHVAKCLEAGMVDHVAKPIRREDLFSKVGRWIAAPMKSEASEAA